MNIGLKAIFEMRFRLMLGKILLSADTICFDAVPIGGRGDRISKLIPSTGTETATGIDPVKVETVDRLFLN